MAATAIEDVADEHEAEGGSRQMTRTWAISSCSYVRLRNVSTMRRPEMAWSPGTRGINVNSRLSEDLGANLPKCLLETPVHTKAGEQVFGITTPGMRRRRGVAGMRSVREAVKRREGITAIRGRL